MSKRKSSKWSRVGARILLCGLTGVFAGTPGKAAPLSSSVENICIVHFDKDTRRPARVEDSALSCLNEAAKRLKEKPDVKLVLVGVSDLVKDYAADQNGKMRDTKTRPATMFVWRIWLPTARSTLSGTSRASTALILRGHCPRPMSLFTVRLSRSTSCRQPQTSIIIISIRQRRMRSHAR